MLSDRKKKILQLIIEDYIETAEPVGSRSIARKYNLGISPATIRNEMSDLELLGYLEQPHTSAGRVPSAAVLGTILNSLAKPDALAPNDVARSTLVPGTGPQHHLISSVRQGAMRMSKNVMLWCWPTRTVSVFSYLRFLPLNEHQAILCIVANDGRMDNSVIPDPGWHEPPGSGTLANR